MLHALIVAAVLNGTVMFRPQSGNEIAPGGVPVGGALVELLQETTTVATATSATDGTFSIPDLAPGTYSSQISSNHSPTKGTIVIHNIDPNLGAEAPRTFYVFDRPCGAIFGRVRDAATGTGVPHAEIGYLGSVVSDSTGDYFISFACWYSNEPYKWSGTFIPNVVARGYKKIWHLMRAEKVDGFIGNVLDFELQPAGTPIEKPPRQHERK